MDTNRKPFESCPICKSSDILYQLSASDYITGDFFNLYKCKNCRTVTTFHLLTDDRMQKYYSGTYYGRRKSFFDSLINFLRMTTGAYNFKIPGSVLDIGCGTGSFLLRLKKRGWEVSGTEFAPKKYIDEVIHPHISQKKIDKAGYKDESFDLITLWHVLEHVDDPFLYLKEASRLLKYGGTLLIEVPNIDSWQAKITKSNWFHIDVPRHRFHFSPESLFTLLAKSGFKKIEIFHGNFIYIFYGFVQSLLNMVSKRKNFMFDLLNKRLAPSEVRKNKFDTLLIFIGIIPVSLISVVLCCGEILFKRAGTIFIKASKE